MRRLVDSSTPQGSRRVRIDCDHNDISTSRLRVVQPQPRTGHRLGRDRNLFEWYDFIIYGFFVPVIATQFFRP